jgi:chorismate synthase
MIRFLTAGESHGPSLTGILDGIPAGLELSETHINEALARRQVGYGSGGRMKIEKDTVRITSGLMNGKTTGAPLTLVVENRDFKNWKEKDIKPIITPRPGHADLTGAIKYGYRELRLSLERASARETTMRVAVGAVCKQFLAQFGVIIGGYVTQIGDAKATVDEQADFLALYEQSEQSDVRCPYPDVAEQMREAVDTARKAKDTLGGVFEIFALNVPVGLGSHTHWDKRLEAKIVSALVSIQAMKGAEIGRAFENAGKAGSEVHDNIDITPDGTIIRRTNRAGGFEGGITTGEPIIARVAMKPIATMLRGAESVNLVTGEPEITTYERSDFCAVPRAVPVGEAMLAIVLADALLEKLGGDSIEEMLPRFAALKKNRLEDVPMDNVTWRFGYE